MNTRPAGIPAGHVMKPCANCGTEIWRYPSRFRAPLAYCSRACQGAPGRLTLQCARCGKGFERPASEVHGETVYCSHACRRGPQAKPPKPRASRPRTRPARDANVRTSTPCPPWPVVTLPEDDAPHDPRAVIRARFRAVRERWEASA